MPFPVPAPVHGPISVPEAAGRLGRLGFLVVNGTRPAAPGGAQLLVAVRDQPTLEHFDPELIQHWAFVNGKGRILDVSRATALPLRRPFSWGTIRATDRLEVYNSFLTFGGELEADRVNGHEIAIVFRSPAPIVRWTGHSQEADPQAGEIGAFFARMMVPVDFTSGAEERIGHLAPLELYAAFLGTIDPHGRSRPDGAADDPAVMFAAEARRIRDADPEAWAAGRTLATDLKLDRE